MIPGRPKVKRIGLIVFLVLSTLLLVAPAVSAGGHGGNSPAKCQTGGDNDGHGHGDAKGKGKCKDHGKGGGTGGQTLQFAATAGNAMPGGSIVLHADVTNADTTVPLTVNA